MISLDEENVQDTLLMVSRIRTQMAARSIRIQSRKDGLSRMTLREVNTLIKRTLQNEIVDADVVLEMNTIVSNLCS